MITSYNIKRYDINSIKLFGNITNKTTGESFDIEQKNSDISEIINSAGEYIAVFSTNPDYKLGLKSGDARNFIFKFTVIENGTAPGPVVNKQSLIEYSHSSISDAYPVYYGLTYSSAAAGNITRSFQNWEDAFEAAYNYEKGVVEKQEDGTYRYTGSFVVGQKEKYDSNWDLTEATNYFAEKAVQKLYFDMSDEFYYLTLPENVISSTNNLRKLELARSVYVFAEGQKELLTELDCLPIINDKPYSYLYTGIGKEPVKSKTIFKFVKDKYSCDSDTVQIVDASGTTIDIQYNKSVGEQLKEAGAVSGVVTIVEKNMYGDETTYEAVYIAESDNTAEIEITYYVDGKKNVKTITQNDNGIRIEAEKFLITNTHDNLDPYGLIKVKNENQIIPYCIKTGVNTDGIVDEWGVNGEYEIVCVNRLGNKFSFFIDVKASDNLAISFSGEGTTELERMVAKIGDKNVALPMLERYGYNFIGYMDDDGEMYTSAIDEIVKAGKMTLKAVWQPKKVKIVTIDYDGKKLKEYDEDFGKKFKLPDYQNDEEIKFVGWEYGGNTVPGNDITIDTEKKITLKAVVEIKPDSTENIEEEQKDDNNITPIIIVISFILAGVFGFVVFSVKKQKKHMGGDDT